MFTARYALSPYITQIGFVFKGLILFVFCKGEMSEICLCFGTETDREIYGRRTGVIREFINLLATDFFFQILAHPVFKM